MNIFSFFGLFKKRRAHTQKKNASSSAVSATLTVSEREWVTLMMNRIAHSDVACFVHFTFDPNTHTVLCDRPAQPDRYGHMDFGILPDIHPAKWEKVWQFITEQADRIEITLRGGEDVRCMVIDISPAKIRDQYKYNPNKITIQLSVVKVSPACRNNGDWGSEGPCTAH